MNYDDLARQVWKNPAVGKYEQEYITADTLPASSFVTHVLP